MGGDAEEVTAQRLPSVWAYAAYVLVFCFLTAGKKSVKSHVTHFLETFLFIVEMTVSGIVGLWTLQVKDVNNANLLFTNSRWEANVLLYCD